MLFAVSVTTKRTSTPSRLRLPFSTMPPMRKVRPCGALLAATSVGVKKNTRFSWNATSTSAVTTPSAASPPTMAAMRLWRGFIFSFHEKNHFKQQSGKGDAIGAPHEPRVASHGQEFAHAPRSLMMQRSRTMQTAMLYIQNANAIRIIPVNMLAAIEGALFSDTDAPWCSVFHHFTEK